MAHDALALGTLALGTLAQGNLAHGTLARGTLAHGTLAHGNKAIRQQGKRQQGIRQQGSKALRQQDNKANGHLLNKQTRGTDWLRVFTSDRKAANFNVAVLRHGQPSLFLK